MYSDMHICIYIYTYVHTHSCFFCRIREISELLQSLDLVSFKVICSSSEFKGRASGKIGQIWGPWDCSVVLFCQANKNWCPNEFRRFLALDRKPGFCDHGRKYFSIFCTAAGNVTILSWLNPPLFITHLLRWPFLDDFSIHSTPPNVPTI